MRKAQSPWIVVGGLILLIVLLVAIVFSYRYATTGLVVDEIDESPPTTTALDNNYPEGPIELRAWVINTDGVKLEVLNRAQKSYILRTIHIEGCGSSSLDLQLSPQESEIISVKCSLEEGKEFGGALTLAYADGASGESMVSKGRVLDTV